MDNELAIVASFQALADPSRVRALMLVRTMELTIGEIAQVLGQSQPRVSRHVRILAEAGLVRRRKEGSWTFVDWPSGASEALAALLDGAAEGPDREMFTADRLRLDHVRQERAEAASRWFESRADRWDALRALHAPNARIEDALVELAGEQPLGTLVDVGTGTGRMIELLGDAARTAIGIDRSPEMLRLARVRLEPVLGEEVQLRQGDMGAIPLPDASADTVVLHLVLHHAHAPGTAIGEAARLLRPGGRLLVVDFDAHGREELRRIHGHQRLGFSDGQIGRWCEDAGIALDDVRSLPGDPLTVKLWSATRPSPRAKAAA